MKIIGIIYEYLKNIITDVKLSMHKQMINIWYNYKCCSLP